MKTIFVSRLWRRVVATMLLTSGVVCAFAQTTDVLKVTQFTLDNGLTVWVNEDHSQPSVYGAVVVKAGARDCPDTGIAHYFEHILFKGTDKIGTVDYEKEKVWLDSISAQYDLLSVTKDEASRRQIQKHINELSQHAAEYAIPNEFSTLISQYGGTKLNAGTSYDETIYYNVFSPQYVEQWCMLNSERLLSPVFRLFQGELETVYEEKNMYADNLLMGAMEHGLAMLFEGTPYAYPIVGSTENLKNPRLSDMKAFYDKYYVASNMGLVLCGDISADNLRPLLERTFGRLRQGVPPERPAVNPKPFDGSKDNILKLPIPLIKIEGIAFRTPTDSHPDYVPVEVMLNLLYNENQTGLLDSLTNQGKMMGAIAASISQFNDANVSLVGYIPNLPFGSRKKANKMVWEQIERIKQGKFSEQTLDELKTSLLRTHEQEMETITGRAAILTELFAKGLTWDDYLDRRRQIEQVSKTDIMRVANTYFGSQNITVHKKMGSYPKDRVSQPGYTPVTPSHAGWQSEYAKALEQVPADDSAVELVDFQHDVNTTAMTPLVTLYTVGNKVNDLFNLQLIFHQGTDEEPMLEHVADYVSELGTDSLTKHQLGQAFGRLGTSLSVQAEDHSTVVTLTGFDSQFEPSVALLAHFLAQPKDDQKKFKDIIQGISVSDRAFFKENSSIAEAVLDKVSLGERSRYLRRVTSGQLKTAGSSRLLSLFQTLQTVQLSIVYSGTLSDENVEQALRRHIRLANVTMPAQDDYPPLQTVSEPTVYLYDNPQARQTIVMTFETLGAMPTVDERTRADLWGSYFGGGMSSLLFQNIREYHSYAYYTGGYPLRNPMKLQPDAEVGYVTMTGTQADKTMPALQTLDTLFTVMPVVGQNLKTAKRSLVSGINNRYPSFRDIGEYVATQRHNGYTKNPEAEVLRRLEPLQMADVTTFYEQHIAHNPRAIMIVGNKKTLDMSILSNYGRIVELKPADIYSK